MRSNIASGIVGVWAAVLSCGVVVGNEAQAQVHEPGGTPPPAQAPAAPQPPTIQAPNAPTSPPPAAPKPPTAPAPTAPSTPTAPPSAAPKAPLSPAPSWPPPAAPKAPTVAAPVAPAPANPPAPKPPTSAAPLTPTPSSQPAPTAPVAPATTNPPAPNTAPVLPAAATNPPPPAAVPSAPAPVTPDAASGTAAPGTVTTTYGQVEPGALPPPPPAAPAPTPQAAAAAAPPPTSYAETRPPTPDLALPPKEQCQLAPVCLGPVATIFSTWGTFGLGVRATYGDYFGASIDYQLLPTINFSKVSIGTGTFSATARVYPFKGKFFAGAGFGYTHMLVRVRSSDDIEAEARVGTPIFILNVGFMGRTGFVFGMDASLLVPLQKLRASISVNPGNRADDIPQDQLDSKREQFSSDVNKALGKVPFLLQLNLVRIGYIF